MTHRTTVIFKKEPYEVVFYEDGTPAMAYPANTAANEEDGAEMIKILKQIQGFLIRCKFSIKEWEDEEYIALKIGDFLEATENEELFTKNSYDSMYITPF